MANSLETTEALQGLIKSQGGDYHTFPSDRTYPSSSSSYASAVKVPPNYKPFVISMYDVEKDEARFPLNLLVNPTDIQYGHAKVVQNSYTRKGWVSSYWGSQQRTLTVSGSTAAFYYNPQQVSASVGSLRTGLTNFGRRNSLAFANLFALVSFFKRNGAYYLNGGTGDNTYWNDGTSRVIHVMDFVMISYDGCDHVGGFNTFTIEDKADNPYRINYNFEFIVSGLRGDFFDGHIRRNGNDEDARVIVSTQGDDMSLERAVEMDVEKLNEYFSTTEARIVGEGSTATPSYTLANSKVDGTSSTFNTALDEVRRFESGYINNPNDRGGATNKGITQKTYDAYRRSLWLPSQSVLNITDTEVNTIYQTRYWDANSCGSLPPALAVVFFDSCVNLGGPQSTKLLQRALGVNDSGVISQETLSSATQNNLTDTVNMCLDLRRKFYYDLVAKDPSQAEFLNGWLKRVDQLQAFVVKEYS